MANRFRRVMVTGGAGYVGSCLVPKLLDAGYEVSVLDLFIFGENIFAHLSNNPGLTEVRGDLRNPADVARGLAGCDAVIHRRRTAVCGRERTSIPRGLRRAAKSVRTLQSRVRGMTGNQPRGGAIYEFLSFLNVCSIFRRGREGGLVARGRAVEVAEGQLRAAELEHADETLESLAHAVALEESLLLCTREFQQLT